MPHGPLSTRGETMLSHSTARVAPGAHVLRLRHLAATALVAASGSGSSCAGNSKSAPFGTIQAALACAGDGDVISLAPSGSTPYPGVGAVSHSVTIKAGGSGNARSVAID